MSKVNVAKIVSDMQKLYAKDKRATSIITTGDVSAKVYTKDDGIDISNHPLAALLGFPVLPYNKIIQVAGSPDTGKSTFAGELVVKAQSNNTHVILWDSEDKFDGKRIKAFGGKPEEILLVKSNEILKGGELVRRYVNAIKDQDKNAKILIIWDSVGGSQSRAHAERELDDERHAQPGQDAKENASIMKMVVALMNKYPDSIAMYLANQTYAKIGFMQKGDKAAGGTKIEYHSSLIVFLKRVKTLTKVVKGAKVKMGIVTRATVTKNHLSQTENSVYQQDFIITAKGSEQTGEMLETTDEDDEG